MPETYFGVIKPEGKKYTGTVIGVENIKGGGDTQEECGRLLTLALLANVYSCKETGIPILKPVNEFPELEEDSTLITIPIKYGLVVQVDRFYQLFRNHLDDMFTKSGYIVTYTNNLADAVKHIEQAKEEQRSIDDVISGTTFKRSSDKNETEVGIWKDLHRAFHKYFSEANFILLGVAEPRDIEKFIEPKVRYISKDIVNLEEIPIFS